MSETLQRLDLSLDQPFEREFEEDVSDFKTALKRYDAALALGFPTSNAFSEHARASMSALRATSEDWLSQLEVGRLLMKRKLSRALSALDKIHDEEIEAADVGMKALTAMSEAALSECVRAQTMLAGLLAASDVKTSALSRALLLAPDVQVQRFHRKMGLSGVVVTRPPLDETTLTIGLSGYKYYCRREKSSLVDDNAAMTERAENDDTLTILLSNARHEYVDPLKPTDVTVSCVAIVPGAEIGTYYFEEVPDTVIIQSVVRTAPGRFTVHYRVRDDCTLPLVFTAHCYGVHSDALRVLPAPFDVTLPLMYKQTRTFRAFSSKPRGGPLIMKTQDRPAFVAADADGMIAAVGIGGKLCMYSIPAFQPGCEFTPTSASIQHRRLLLINARFLSSDILILMASDPRTSANIYFLRLYTTLTLVTVQQESVVFKLSEPPIELAAKADLVAFATGIHIHILTSQSFIPIVSVPNEWPCKGLCFSADATRLSVLSSKHITRYDVGHVAFSTTHKHIPRVSTIEIEECRRELNVRMTTDARDHLIVLCPAKNIRAYNPFDNSTTVVFTMSLTDPETLTWSEIVCTGPWMLCINSERQVVCFTN